MFRKKTSLSLVYKNVLHKVDMKALGHGLVHLFLSFSNFLGQDLHPVELAVKPRVHVAEIPVGHLKALVERRQEGQRLLRILVQLPNFVLSI